MRPGQQQNKRMRGRGRKGPNPLSRSYESNGPDVKIRGTAQHIAEKYSTLARDAAASGDRVMAENYLQHAEHYGRIVAAAQGSFQLQQDENDGSEQDEDDDGEEEGGFTNANGQAYPQQRVQQDRPQFQDRSQGERNQQDRSSLPPAMRDNREGRDNNREARDGNREQRDVRPQQETRDGNRENRGNRDANGNRDNNREGRDVNNRGNREGYRENRDLNRENQQNREARDNNRDRQMPGGLGPQPFLPETRPQPQAEPVAVRSEQVVVRDPATQEQPAREEFRSRADEQAGEREPRRRGRPRRIRSEDAVQAPVSSEAAAAPIASEAPQRFEAPAHVGAASSEAAPEPATTRPLAATEGEAKVKRKPGRPRKKKPEDDTGGDDGGDGGSHLPAFLMASNG